MEKTKQNLAKQANYDAKLFEQIKKQSLGKLLEEFPEDWLSEYSITYLFETHWNRLKGSQYNNEKDFFKSFFKSVRADFMFEILHRINDISAFEKAKNKSLKKLCYEFKTDETDTEYETYIYYIKHWLRLENEPKTSLAHQFNSLHLSVKNDYSTLLKSTRGQFKDSMVEYPEFDLPNDNTLEPFDSNMYDILTILSQQSLTQFGEHYDVAESMFLKMYQPILRRNFWVNGIEKGLQNISAINPEIKPFKLFFTYNPCNKLQTWINTNQNP